MIGAKVSELHDDVVTRAVCYYSWVAPRVSLMTHNNSEGYNISIGLSRIVYLCLSYCLSLFSPPTQQTTTTTTKSTPTPTPTAVTRVELGGRHAVSLECDWGVGIGGSVWSTGLLLAEHLSRHAALYDGVFRGKRLLELGSGTGFVGVVHVYTRPCDKRVDSFYQPPTQQSYATYNERSPAMPPVLLHRAEHVDSKYNTALTLNSSTSFSWQSVG